MATSLGEAVLEVGADTTNLRKDVERGTKRAFSGAEKDADGLGKKTGAGFGGGIVAGLGRFAGPIAGVFAGISAVDFLKESVNVASDLGESINAVRVTYGKAADDVLRFGESSATSLGIAQGDLNQFAVRFSAFANQLATGGKSSGQVFQDIAKRATDFASVMNLEVADAAQAFQSGLAGETEPLRAFGIDLSDAAIKAFAYANNIAKTGQELTEAQKVQARYGVLMQQTNRFAGDFAKTSGGLANQQRILSAQVKTLQVGLGNLLLPTITRIVAGFNQVVPTITKVVQGFQSGGQAGGQFGATIDSIRTFLAPLVAQVRDLAGQAADVLGPGLAQIGSIITGQVLPAFRAFLPAIAPIAKVLLSIFGGAVIGLIQGFVNVIRGALTIISGLFNVFTGLLTGDWDRLWSGLRQILSGAITAISGVIQVWWNGSILAIFRRGILFLTKNLWVSLWNGLRSGASAGLSLVGRVITGGLQFISRTFIGAVRGYIGLWASLFRNLLSLAQTGLRVVQSAFGGILSAIRTVVAQAASSIATTFRNGLTSAATAVRNGVSTVLGIFRNLPGQVVSAMGNLGGRLVSAGRDLINGLVRGIRDAAGAVAQAASDVVGNAIDAAKRKLRIASPSKVFKELGAFVGEGFALGMEGESGRVGAAGSRMSTAAAQGAGLRVPTGSTLGGSTAPLQVPRPTTPTRAATTAPAAGTVVNQNFYGPTTSGGRLREMQWTLDYATGGRRNTVDGVAA